MSCPESEILSDFADGALDAAAGSKVEHHLSTCSSCREHVEEMRWLDALGRSSLGAIRVAVQRNSTALFEAPTRSGFLRPMALAAAAIGLILLSFAAWRISNGFREPPRASEPNQQVSDSASEDQNQIKAETGARMDETFERWVQPYRRLRIPLVPMEDLANFNTGRTVPAEPAPMKRGGAG